MASRVKRPNGHYWIQFTDPDGARQTVRLGKLPANAADGIKHKVEALLSARLLGSPIDPETARWVAACPPNLAAKLSAVGLIDRRLAATVGELIEYHDRTRKHKSKTDENEHRYTKDHLVSFFGDDKPLHSINRADAKEFFLWLKDDEGLADSTAGKRFEKSKRYFDLAVDKRWLTANPFLDIKTKCKAPRDRDETVSQEVADKVLAETTDYRMRLMFALARYGGMRAPSEPLELRWEQFNWEEKTITFHAPKTRTWRTIPMFAKLQPYIDEAWDRAEENAELVFGDWKPTSAAITSRLKKILNRLGIPIWPKPWQNLRCTCENELAEDYPAHVVHTWIGHSADTAREHYLRVVKEHIEKATAPPKKGAAKTRSKTRSTKNQK